MRTGGPKTDGHNLGPASRIPVGEGRAFCIEGEEIAIFRNREGEVCAVQARCPHRGGALAEGLVAAGRVTCPLHAREFDLCTGRSERGDCPDLRTYPVIVTESGELVVIVSESA
jgi:nitrite reductase (NADH) small subunit